MQHRSPPLRALTGALLPLALAAAGCNEETAPIIVDDSSSSAALYFRLTDFIGDVPCSDAPGALRSYVVTLIDRTGSDICGDGACVSPETAGTCARDCADPAPCGDGTCSADAAAPETAETCPVDCDGTLPPPFTLPSSLPVPCSQGVRFDNVAGNHLYSVQIDGYEAFADQLGPQGWNAADAAVRHSARRSGSRHMVDAAGNPLSPRWIGACGEGEAPRTLVAETGTTQVLDCGPIADLAGSSATVVEVAPAEALGSLRCAADAAPGEPAVAEVDIFSDDGLGNVLGLSCDAAPQLYAGEALVPGTSVSFYVAAHAEQGGPVTWGSTCAAAVQEGVTVRAACVPLTDKGALTVDMPAVLAAAGFACGGDVTSYDVVIAGASGTFQKNGVPCKTVLSFGALLPGDYTGEIAVTAADGQSLFSAACDAKVEPGRTTAASCIPQ